MKLNSKSTQYWKLKLKKKNNSSQLKLTYQTCKTGHETRIL